MATDFLLLQHYPDADHARFRSYGWQRPACTFGFSQKIAFVREHLPADFEGELCRRPTGGGIVDHRYDWTYALVIPRGAALYDERAVESYRLIHVALTHALVACGIPAEIKTDCDPPAADPDGLNDNAAAVACRPVGPGVCFQRAERHDVIHAGTGAKLAGAAQKRAKRGLLFQGSVDRAAVEHAGAIDWTQFSDTFIAHLADALAADAAPAAWPDIDEAVDQLAEQYAMPEWVEYR